MTLCDRCQAILTLKPPFSKYGYDTVTVYSHTFATLISSMRQNCYFCHQLYQRLSPEQLHAFKELPTARIKCCLSWVNGKFRNLRFHSEDFDADRYPEGELYLFMPSTEFKDQVESHILPNSTNDVKCWALISKWIQRCETSHHLCSLPSNQHSWRPTRLVDVGPLASDLPRLINTKSLQNSRTFSYLALSHCWGTSKIPTLTTSNIKNLQRMIPISEMPPNFQDAIRATRALGFQYLWIDSLCIVQDSPEDWLAESAVMGKIYRNATLCISATGSNNAEGGLFRTRDTVYVSPKRLDTHTESHTRSYYAVRCDLWRSGVTESPLNRRAWFLQERLFAPRTVHFGDKQIFWECRELEACEILPDRIPIRFLEAPGSHLSFGAGGFKRWETNIRDGLNLEGQFKHENDDTHSLFIPARPAYELWESIVQMYMRCGLTKSSDKLVALSGAAMEIQNILNDTYLAGLWRSHLISQLLWYVSPYTNGPQSRRALPYRAPTWSWASVDGWIDYSPSSGEQGEAHFQGGFAEVLDAQVTPASTTNELGQVLDGHLRIRGQLARFNVSEVDAIYEAGSLVSTWFYPDDIEEIDASEYFTLPLVSSIGWMIERLEGLVLAPVDLEQGVYKRVAYFRIDEIDHLKYLGYTTPERCKATLEPDLFAPKIERSTITII